MAGPLPEETTPGQRSSEETTPAQRTPEETTPAQRTPEETTPAQRTPEETTPAQRTPEETTQPGARAYQWSELFREPGDVLSRSVPVPIPPGVSPEEARRRSRLVIVEVNQQLPNDLPEDSATVSQLVEAAGIDPQGNILPVEEVAERLVELFGEVRTTGDQSGGNSEPLGAVVTANVELVGLRGEPVLLSWSIWQVGGTERLYGQWLTTNPAYQLTATRERDTTAVNLWVPLPTTHGPYLVRLDLMLGGSRLTSEDTHPFD